MTDMLSVIEPKSDQINAEDLIGRDMTITVRSVQVRAGTEQPVSIQFAGSDKVFRPCKTVSRILVAAWGPDTSAYIGRSLTLFRDPKVKWGGMEVGGIRVRAMTHIDAPLKLALAESKKARTITVVQPLKVDAPASPADAALDWTDKRVALLASATTVAAIDDVMAKSRTGADKIAKDRPELFTRLLDAETEARARIGDDPFTDANDGTLSEENPAATEGRADEDMGERITDDLLASHSA
jgi:hypothetical protein